MTIRGINNQTKTITSSGSAKYETQKGEIIENKENTTAMNKLVENGAIKSKGDYVESIPLFLDETYAGLYDMSKTFKAEDPSDGKPAAKKEKGKPGSKLYKMQWLKDKLQE